MEYEKVLLVRHGLAGRRRHWEGLDEERPLSGMGRRQAQWLADLPLTDGVRTVMTSPYVRCVQTVEPLAERRALRVDAVDALAEGAKVDVALSALMEARAPVVACTHGDVLESVIGSISSMKAPKMAKGSLWVLRRCIGGLEAVEYLSPPRSRRVVKTEHDRQRAGAVAFMARAEVAFRAADVDAVLELFDDDVVVVFGDFPIMHGKAAYHEFLRARMARQQNYRPTTTVRSIDGDVIGSSWESTWTDARSGSLMCGRGCEFVRVRDGKAIEFVVSFNAWDPVDGPVTPII